MRIPWVCHPINRKLSMSNGFFFALLTRGVKTIKRTQVLWSETLVESPALPLMVQPPFGSWEETSWSLVFVTLNLMYQLGSYGAQAFGQTLFWTFLWVIIFFMRLTVKLVNLHNRMGLTQSVEDLNRAKNGLQNSASRWPSDWNCNPSLGLLPAILPIRFWIHQASKLHEPAVRNKSLSTYLSSIYLFAHTSRELCFSGEPRRMQHSSSIMWDEDCSIPKTCWTAQWVKTE